MSQGTQVHMVSSNVESLKFWKESSATVLIEIFGKRSIGREKGPLV